jgi:group I intron endonuclease
MTVGIYALYWEEPDLTYVGKSTDLSTRKSSNMRQLRKMQHENYKVQNTFNEFGEPDFIVLEQCSTNVLDSREVYWVVEFNSLFNGLNINQLGTCASYGPKSSNSKYSRTQILKAFSLLYKTDKSYKEISVRVKMPEVAIRHIKNKKHILG